MADDDRWPEQTPSSHRGGIDEEPHAHIRHFESKKKNQKVPDVPNTPSTPSLPIFSDAALEDKMTLTFRNEMNEMKNMMKALVPTPAPIKAVEEKCTTCGSNHSFNVCPMTRGGYESPVYHDNFQQFQQTASVVLANILKKLPDKLETPTISQSRVNFSELKCKALADLGASINLMPFSVYTKLGLPALQSTRMTLELANCSLCVPKGIARDVLVPVGNLLFPPILLIDLRVITRVPLKLGRPFLEPHGSLINVHWKS
ncbi:reverse transcriptase domain-containing protein [Tanacetum coccineum]